MPAKPLPLEAVEPPERDPRIHEQLWALPKRLVLEGNRLGLSQQDVADGARVSQSTVSRWLMYKGLEGAAAGAISLENALGLPHGWLTRPLSEDAENSQNHSQPLQRLIRLGVDKSMVIRTDDMWARVEETMAGFPEDLRQAVLGVVHVLGHPIDSVLPIAKAVLAANPEADWAPEMWFGAIRSTGQLPARPRSGLRPAVKQSSRPPQKPNR